MIGVIDYGAGNLQSVANALAYIGHAPKVCAHPADLVGVSHVVLPGVGHFSAASEHLRRVMLTDALRTWVEDQRPLLGVCLGLQLLFETSEEGSAADPPARQRGTADADDPARAAEAARESLEAPQANGPPGLGVLSGRVTRLHTSRVPHMGWNTVRVTRPDPLLDAADGRHFYFAHAYGVRGSEATAAVTDVDGVTVVAAVGRGRVWGVQFHPEKSAEAGLELLRRFAEC
jgi:imidazoleglycerol phosphate synthase glutamine amidotransferase subunit HisH